MANRPTKGSAGTEHAAGNASNGTDSPELRPPGRVPAENRNSPSGRPVGTYAALAALALAVFAAIFVLPHLIGDPTGSGDVESRSNESVRSDQAPDSVTAESGDRAGGDEPAREATRADAETALRSYLGAHARLQLMNAPAWAQWEWQKAGETVEHGDKLFAQRRFDEAFDAYTDAGATLSRIELSRDSQLSDSIAEGEAALGKNQFDRATALFERALVIEPKQAAALRGLARAKVREQLLAALERGHALAGVNDLDGAAEAFASALALDSDYRPAQEALQANTARIEDRDFSTAMSSALTALNEGHFDESAAAFDAAARLRTDDPSVAAGRSELATARRTARTDALRRQARAAERSEKWNDVIRYYQEVLGVSPNASFARTGLAAAESQLRFHQRVDHYLEDPTRLHSPAPFEDAERLVLSAKPFPVDQPKLRAKLVALEHHIDAAAVPLSVTVHSDGETDIAIYHVGRLGRFIEKELSLRPGTYTAVGTRHGYRDVRRQLIVHPGSESTRFVVACEERI